MGGVATLVAGNHSSNHLTSSRQKANKFATPGVAKRYLANKFASTDVAE